MFKGKVVANNPHINDEGNTWMADVVYQIDKNYFVQKVVAPIKHGPYVVGEEIDVDHEVSDALAEDWMIEVFKNPKRYKAAMKVKSEDNKARLEAALKDEEEIKPKNTVLNLIIALLLIALLAMLLWILIFKK